MKRIELFSVALIVLATLLLAGSIVMPGETDALSRLKAGEPIRIGYALEAPFVSLDSSGAVTGTEPETLRAALSEIGPVRAVWIHADFGSLIHELRSGRIDIVCAGMYITEERSAKLVFSKPTMTVNGALLVKAGNPLGLASIESAATRAGARLAVLAGAVEEQVARRSGLSGERLVAFGDAGEAFSALLLGRVDALALSLPSARRLAAGEGRGSTQLVSGVEVVPVPGQPAFAFRRGDAALRDAVDAALAGYVGSDRHRALLARFGAEDLDRLAAGPASHR